MNLIRNCRFCIWLFLRETANRFLSFLKIPIYEILMKTKIVPCSLACCYSRTCCTVGEKRIFIRYVYHHPKTRKRSNCSRFRCCKKQKAVEIPPALLVVHVVICFNGQNTRNYFAGFSMQIIVAELTSNLETERRDHCAFDDLNRTCRIRSCKSRNILNDHILVFSNVPNPYPDTHWMSEFKIKGFESHRIDPWWL